MVKELNEIEFSEAIKEGKVVIDCFAPWCGPCRMLSPIIDEVAGELTDYTFYKLNVDDAEEVCRKYGIMSIPALLILENGELQQKLVGFKSKSELKEILK